MSMITGLALFAIMGMASTSELSAGPLENNGNSHSPLLERIAEKFDLDIDEVKDFLRELKEERKVGMEERLDELVEDGKITDNQKEAILEKKEELETLKEELKDMKASEARKAMKEIKEEFKDWIEKNDLELKYFFSGNGLKKIKSNIGRSSGQGFRW